MTVSMTALAFTVFAAAAPYGTRTYFCSLENTAALGGDAAYVQVSDAAPATVKFTHAKYWSINFCDGRQPGGGGEFIYDACRFTDGKVTARRRVAVYRDANGRVINRPRYLDTRRIELFDFRTLAGVWPGDRPQYPLTHCRRVANF